MLGRGGLVEGGVDKEREREQTEEERWEDSRQRMSERERPRGGERERGEVVGGGDSGGVLLIVNRPSV